MRNENGGELPFCQDCLGMVMKIKHVYESNAPIARFTCPCKCSALREWICWNRKLKRNSDELFSAFDGAMHIELLKSLYVCATGYLNVEKMRASYNKMDDTDDRKEKLQRTIELIIRMRDEVGERVERV
jgi:hypothetical protein